MGSSGAEWGGLARESAAVASGCSGSRTAPQPAPLTPVRLWLKRGRMTSLVLTGVPVVCDLMLRTRSL